MSKILWHTIQIKVPMDMVELTKTGKVSVRKTLTKTFNIGKSQKKPAIKLIPSNISKPEIINDGKEWNVEELKSKMKKAKELEVKNKSKKDYKYSEKLKKAVGDKVRKLRQKKITEKYEELNSEVKKLKPIEIKKKIEPEPQTKKMKQVNSSYEVVEKYMKSPSTRSKDFLIKVGLTKAEIDDILGSKKLNDFYPTPDEYIDSDSIKKSKNILEGTCGLGFVVRRILEINPTANITAIEENGRAVIVGNKLLDDIAKITEGDFFELPDKNNYDFIFLNPPFTSGYSKKDNFYIKFVIKLILMINENKHSDKLNCQLLIPPRFLPSDLEVDNFFEFTLFDKCPEKEFKKYCNELNTTPDDLDGMLSGIYTQFRGYAKFSTTNFKIANIKISTNVYN